MDEQAKQNKLPEHIKVLSIVLDQNTRMVNVAGPVNDKLLSYSMLELARDAIYDYNRKLEEEKGNIPGVVTP